MTGALDWATIARTRMSQLHEFGLVGLAVMGRNLALNLADHGLRVAVYNLEPELTAIAVAESGERLQGVPSLEQLVASLQRPRRIMLMIRAGAPVDAVLAQLRPLLDRGDIVIDGGNSHYSDTRRRERECAESDLRFLGVGVSGGEAGARHGPSLMPGGSREAYEALAPIFESIAARTDAGPCVAYLGPDGAGHFVKMMHNGIEYADMQVIAEAYHLLTAVIGLEPGALADVFTRWNQGPLESFLIDLTAKVFAVSDPKTGGPLIDQVLDQAGQKGTGRSAAVLAFERGIPTPSIAAAVDARALSSRKTQRQRMARVIRGPVVSPFAGDPTAFITEVRDALDAAKIIAYAQGMDMIAQSSAEYDWGIRLAEVARIWKGGCILRARMLDAIVRAYTRDPELENLLLDPEVRERVEGGQSALRRVAAIAIERGIPVPGLTSALGYFDSLRSESLPQNLIQAQRDAFGAHTYQRRDDPDGPFIHTDWLADG